jgi:hypothetical protein
MSLIKIPFVCQRAAPTLLAPSVENGRIMAGDIAICHDGALIATTINNEIFWVDLKKHENSTVN